MRVAQTPFRDPARVPESEQGPMAGVQTNWVSVADVTEGIYYVNSATAPSLFWLELRKANFRQGAPVLFLDPHDPRVGGDARRHLKRWRAPAVLAASSGYPPDLQARERL